MTNQDINKAVAEALGWKEVRTVRYVLLDQPKSGMVGAMPGRDETWLHVPDYVNDLNAMHEAEAYLDSLDNGEHAGCARYQYAGHLYGTVVPIGVQPIRATARHRAEAFLRAIGEWRDA